MKKKILIPVMFMSFLLVGCTSPTQRLAAKSLSEGVDQSHSVFYDMSRIARQKILNAGAIAAADAAAAGDTARAQAVVKDVFDQMNTIDWLHIQWERSRALIRIGQSYIWEQKGVLDILIKELRQSKANYEQKNST